MEFHSRFDRTGFTSGEQVLDDWLKLYAGQSERRNTTKTFLAVVGSRVVGYYTSTMCQLSVDESTAVRPGGRYPIPAIVLARLAVDVEWQGRGVGRCLLAHALANYAAVARAVGFEIVLVHALTERAVDYYLAFGFRRLSQESKTVFMTTKDLIASIPD